MLFAGFIKLFIPLLVVIPGIAAFALDAPLGKSDEAYPWLLGNLLPVGVKGVAFAALTAAIVSSLASMMNSISTIFTMISTVPISERRPGRKSWFIPDVGRASARCW